MAFKSHEHWSGRLAFVMAAVGSSVGLGNFWRFPYQAGEFGGGAFILLYLLCIAVVGFPVLLSELMIGRRSGLSAMRAAGAIAQSLGAPKAWNAVGLFGTIGGTLIVTFYSVIAGWIIAYLPMFVNGALADVEPEEAGRRFSELLASPGRQTIYHAIFMGLTVFIIARGVKSGIEKAVGVMMPAFFVMLLGITVYAAFVGDFGKAASFLFTVDFSKVMRADAALAALGQACFSLSVGSAIMITYGAYTDRDISLPRSAGVIAASDTFVALIAGLAIFPFVFAYGFDPQGGPGLLFVTLPSAFAQAPGGAIIGVVFMLLALFAALTSSISLLETVVSHAEERGANRVVAAVAAGGAAFVIGIGSVLSNNLWADVRPPAWVPFFGGQNFFDAIDFLTSQLVLPIAAFLSVIFAGWIMTRDMTADEFGGRGAGYRFWRFTARWVSPGLVGLILIAAVWSRLSAQYGG